MRSQKGETSGRKVLWQTDDIIENKLNDRVAVSLDGWVDPVFDDNRSNYTRAQWRQLDGGFWFRMLKLPGDETLIIERGRIRVNFDTGDIIFEKDSQITAIVLNRGALVFGVPYAQLEVRCAPPDAK